MFDENDHEDESELSYTEYAQQEKAFRGQFDEYFQDTILDFFDISLKTDSLEYNDLLNKMMLLENLALEAYEDPEYTIKTLKLLTHLDILNSDYYFDVSNQMTLDYFFDRASKILIDASKPVNKQKKSTYDEDKIINDAKKTYKEQEELLAAALLEEDTEELNRDVELGEGLELKSVEPGNYVKPEDQTKSENSTEQEDFDAPEELEEEELVKDYYLALVKETLYGYYEYKDIDDAVQYHKDVLDKNIAYQQKVTGEYKHEIFDVWEKFLSSAENSRSMRNMFFPGTMGLISDLKTKNLPTHLLKKVELLDAMTIISSPGTSVQDVQDTMNLISIDPAVSDIIPSLHIYAENCLEQAQEIEDILTGEIEDDFADEIEDDFADEMIDVIEEKAIIVANTYHEPYIPTEAFLADYKWREAMYTKYSDREYPEETLLNSAVYFEIMTGLEKNSTLEDIKNLSSRSCDGFEMSEEVKPAFLKFAELTIDRLEKRDKTLCSSRRLSADKQADYAKYLTDVFITEFEDNKNPEVTELEKRLKNIFKELLKNKSLTKPQAKNIEKSLEALNETQSKMNYLKHLKINETGIGSIDDDIKKTGANKRTSNNDDTPGNDLDSRSGKGL